MKLAWRGWRPALPVAALTLLTLWPQPYIEELRSPNELVRVYLTRALVDDHTVQLDTAFARYGGLVDKAERDGHLYCDKAPGASFLAVPVYAALRLFASAEALDNATLVRLFRGVWLVLPTLLFALLLRLWLSRRGVRPETARIAPFAYILGTLALAYCGAWLGHQAAAWMLGLAWLCADLSRDDGKAWLRVAAGFCAALAAITEYPTAVLLAVVAWLALWRAPKPWQGAADLALGATGPLLLGALYHQAAFGAPWATGYAFISNPAFRAVHAEGLLGVGWPRWETLGELTFGYQRGLFLLAPWLLLAVFAWRRTADRGRLVGALGLNVGLQFWVAAGFSYWIGGWSAGPRHFVPALPALCVLALLGLDALHTRVATQPWQKALPHAARGLLAYSLVACAAVALTFPSYPEPIIAPLFEQTLTLWGRLQGPHSLGTFVGLRSDVALALSGATALALVYWVQRSLATRLADVGIALWLGVLLLFAVAALRPRPTPESVFITAWLLDTKWQPRDVERPADPRLTRFERSAAELQRAQPSVAAWQSVGATNAHAGRTLEALEAYVRAAHLAATHEQPPR